jgi:hypothetical protein
VLQHEGVPGACTSCLLNTIDSKDRFLALSCSTTTRRREELSTVGVGEGAVVVRATDWLACVREGMPKRVWRGSHAHS